VIANDSYAFAAAYGGSIPVVGEFGGRLQNGGETLKLVRPGATLGTEIIVNRVRYDSALPWPTNAGGFGPSVQLRDPLQDNSRVANWAASSINGGAALYTPGAANSTLTTLPPMPALWINEILPNNVSGLADRFGHREPWIEIYNASANAVSLDGLYLTDNYTNLTVWPFPAGTVINPKQFLIVWADGKPSETGSGELHTSFRLNETGGSVALVWTATGAPLVLDYLNYSTFSADRSYGSYPDGQPFTRQVFHFTSPGGTNIPTSVTVPVVINEFMAGNTHTLTNCARQYDDWIELYNTGNTTVDLSGYYLTDNLTNKTKWAFPQGTFIPAHGYRLVWADDAPCHDTDLHALFKLGAGGEQIGLFAPDGTLIDGLTFPNQKDDVSYGRWPDGAGSTFYSMNQPTPRAANILAANNSPPSVGSITDKTVDELSLLTFTATADDPDAPTQQLTFSLDSNAPDGAAINAQSGLFTWQPVEDQGPGIYTIVVRATDNGSPPLSGSRSFRVTVSEMNSAPVLSPIPDQTISVGNVLSVTAGATDADRPAQKLTFSLDPGAPTGATLDASSGLFSWTPLPAQAPSTNTISVRVTDDGSPPLAAFRTFAVIVREAPTFSATALLVNNVITITWQTIPGKTYQVQHNTSLTDGSWQALGANLTAPGSTASMTDTPTNTQRFYRVVRLD
jgi:hypothetical protein